MRIIKNNFELQIAMERLILKKENFDIWFKPKFDSFLRKKVTIKKNKTLGYYQIRIK